MTDLKKELLRFKDIVDGMTDKAEKILMDINLSNGLNYEEFRLLDDKRNKARIGINAILELAEELEKDND